MVSYYQIEGINTFFVIQVDMTAANSYETDMLYNNFVEGIIQPEFRALNGEMLLYSKINGMRSLRDMMNMGVLSVEKTMGLMSSLYNVIIETGEYMLYPDNLVIASDKIFYSPLTDDFHYIYVPGTGIDIRAQMKKLVEDVIRQIDHGDPRLVDFMYELYGMATSPNCDIPAMHDYVNEQKMELLDRNTRGTDAVRTKMRCDADGQTKTSGSAAGQIEMSESVDMQTMAPGDVNRNTKTLWNANRKTKTLGNMAGQTRAPENVAGQTKTPGNADKTGKDHGSKNKDIKSKDKYGRENDRKERDSMLDIVFGGDSGDGACVAAVPVESGVWQRRLILCIGVTAIGGICMLLSQIVIGGGITDVRFLMVILALLSVELLVYIELRKKEIQDPSGVIKKKSNYGDNGSRRGITGGFEDFQKNVAGSHYEDHGNNMNGKNEGYGCNIEPGENTEIIKSPAYPQVKLISCSGEFVMDITSEGKIIGRDERVSDVVINDTSISRQHVYIYPDAGKVYVEDMGSTNGTIINGIRLPKGEAWLLADGDIICIGEQEYRIQILLI